MSGALLDAGLLPATADQGEIIRARSYTHPLLGGRSVVRLAGDTVAPGEDGALAFLGFGEPA
ncbi:MAG: hypothetical protein ABIS86_00100, partial [Streptosporangiaceae bacterium]